MSVVGQRFRKCPRETGFNDRRTRNLPHNSQSAEPKMGRKQITSENIQTPMSQRKSLGFGFGYQPDGRLNGAGARLGNGICIRRFVCKPRIPRVFSSGSGQFFRNGDTLCLFLTLSNTAQNNCGPLTCTYKGEEFHV